MSDTQNTSFSLSTVIHSAIQIPGVKVNRDAFLREIFKNVSSDRLQQIVQEGPIHAGCSHAELKKKAQRLIKERTLFSSGASFVSGLPGGFAMAAAIPADVLQFYGVALRLAQELAYLYGEQDLWSGDILDEEKITNQLILYCGVMLGATGAAQTVRILSSSLAKQALKKIPQQALTKTIYYPIIKSIAKAFGAKMTKEIFAKGVSKAVPLIGGVVSGGITFATMRPMGQRLADTLDKAQFSYSETDFQQDWQEVNTVAEAELAEEAAQSDSSAPHETPISANSATSPLDKIQQAMQMLQDGIITEEEFSKIKEKLIAEM